MQYREYAPDPILNDAVQCFWTTIRNFEETCGSVDILPDSYVEVVFNVGENCQFDDGQQCQALPAFYAVNVLEKPFRLHSTSQLTTVAARFYAWGFESLFGETLDPAAIIHPLDESWQPVAESIREAILRGDEDAAVEALHRHLLSMVKRAHRVYQRPAVVLTASHLLLDQKGAVSIDGVADACHISRRQLERQFQRRVGFSPKRLARTMRFQHVRDSLCADPDADLLTLAQEFGYADQSHLSREFRSFSNRTLREFAHEKRAHNDLWQYGVANNTTNL